MELYPLPIFPEGGLSGSIITTVWVGIWVICFFNLRFGWVLSGLVVPGYLTPLLLSKPLSAAVVLLEGFLTYAIVWTLSERLSGARTWHNLFGRDRFFALVLASIAARLVLDGWLLPLFGAWLEEHWHIAFDYRNNLHSYGLIVVSLIANQFWKTGFWRGLPPLFITLASTVLIVRFGLMEFTNFGFGALEYAYNDLASSVLASPKAYIILIATAFLASRMNLHYGWDFNGILIPSLLALQWYQPEKILVTLLEAGIILGLSVLVLRLPPFNRMSMEGARKLLLFFNVGFAYKLMLGHALLAFAPNQNITDYYAFGYLLATLIATKIHDKDILARLTRSTLQTSLVAVAYASLVGFALTLVPDPRQWLSQYSPPAPTAQLLERSDQELSQRLETDRVNLYQARTSASFQQPLPSEERAIQAGLDAIDRYGRSGDAKDLDQATAAFAQVDYRIERLAGGYLYLSQDDATPPRYWGLLILDPQAAGTLLIEVPQALEEARTLDAALSLFKTFQARGLLISGSTRRGAVNPAGDVRLNRRSPFHLAHRQLNRGNALQVRAYLPDRTPPAGAEERNPSLLWVKESLPRGLNPGQLKELLGQFQILWGRPPERNFQRDDSNEGFAELFLAPEDLRRLIYRPQAVERVESGVAIDGHLQEWLLDTKGAIADAGSEAYQPARVEELLFLDEEVLSPLLTLIRTQYQGGDWSATAAAELTAIGRAAALLDYRLIQYRHRVTGRDFLILAEREDRPRRRYWGTYVLRLGPVQDYLVQVPRPLQETNSFEFAVSLFETLEARALLIAGAHPKANLDNSADLVTLTNKTSLFSLVSQVLVREAGDQPLVLVQSRAFGYRVDRPPPDAEILVAVDSGAASPAQLTPPQLQLLERLSSGAMRWRLVDGSLQTQGYEVGGVAQAQYLTASRGKSFMLLWLSPTARFAYRQQDENRWQNAQFQAVEIPSWSTDLYQFLDRQRDWRQAPDGMKDDVAAYLRQPDVVRLAQIKGHWPGWTWRRLLDTNSKQAFLVASDAQQRLALVANLAPRGEDSVTLDRSQLWDSLARYLARRAAWLEWPP